MQAGKVRHSGKGWLQYKSLWKGMVIVMGKPTGFLEYNRKDDRAAEPLERIKNFNEFHTPMSDKERKEQAARCMNCGVPFCQSGMVLNGKGIKDVNAY